MEYSNEMLTRTMATAGARNGFEEVKAEFAAFRDFKLKWTRSYKWINFEVSDYLRNAPENVIGSLAETIYAKIGGAERTEYSQDVCDYLNSEEFLRENQNLFIKRFRGLSPTARGNDVDLEESYRRLTEKGLVKNDPRIVIRWTEDGRSRIGISSVLMKTIAMNNKLDDNGLSENAIDYALYSQICHVNLGFGATRDDDPERYEAMLSDYPGRREAETELRHLGLRI